MIIKIQRNVTQHNNAQSIVHDGINREYVLYIPNSYDGTSSVPLMLNFHGFGGSARRIIWKNADLRSVAETNTFILVYPQGSCLRWFFPLESLPKRTRQ